MNIVFLLRFFPQYGGGEAVTLQLANELVKRNHRVTIVYLWKKESHDVFISDKIVTIQIKNVSSPVNIDDINNNDLKLLKESLKTILYEQKCDIIVNQWWPSRIVHDANKLQNSKIIKCHHTSVIRNSHKREVLKKIVGNLLYSLLLKKIIKRELNNDFRYSDSWVFLSEESKKEAEWVFGKSNKYVVVNNPCKYISDSSYIDQKEKMMLFVGRLLPVKNIYFLIDAWKSIENLAIELEWKLLILGDGILKEDLEHYVSEISCKNICFMGNQEPLSFYKKAMAIGVTSETEGWPLVLVEAMANGCVPIVRNTFGSLKEIVHNSVDGIVVAENAAPKEFGDCIANVFMDFDSRKILAQNAVSESSKYNIDVIVTRWESLFHAIQRI